MNCKPGDLAIIIPPGFPENLGKVVHCLKLLESNITPDGVPLDPSSGAVWVIDRPILWKRILPISQGGGLVTKQSCLACDDTLMPISPPADWEEECDSPMAEHELNRLVHA
jgi:hypothetical protein